MSPWTLLLLIFVAWVVYFYSALAQRAVEHARSGRPREQQRGVSLLPVIPLAPLAVWGITLLLDLAVDRWGTVVVAVIHMALLVFALLAIGRDAWRLRGLKRGD